MDRFRELASSGGVGVALARGASRFLDLTGQRLQAAGKRLVDPATMEARLPAELAGWLAANKALGGKCRGQQVVLLASGESSANLDRQILRDRPVIAMNEMFRSVIAAGLPLAGVVIHDSMYFNGSPQMSKMLQDAVGAAREAGALLVIPAAYARQLAEREMLDPQKMLTFFESGHAVYDLPRPGRVLDLATVVPSLATVAHAALVAAIYLGYSEIAILGVDLRYISSPNSPVVHAYGANPYLASLDEQTAAQAYLRSQGWPWPMVLRHVASQLEAYAWLAEGAAGQGQRIVNLSRDSLLSTVDAIEQGQI
jgi:hypothetical protein